MKNCWFLAYLRREKSSQKYNVTNYKTENKRPQRIASLGGLQQLHDVWLRRESDFADCNNHHNYLSHNPAT
jgi:hypothetical protein